MKSLMTILMMLVLLNGCTTNRSDPPGAFSLGLTEDISERLSQLDAFQTSARVIAASRYNRRIDNYPITVFVFSELDAYLAEQSMTKQALLESPKLDDFVRSTMLSEYRINWVSNASQTQTQQLQTLAGNTFTTVDYEIIDDSTIDTEFGNEYPVDAFTFDVEGQKVLCVVHIKRNPFVEAFLCRTTRPFVEFDW